MFSLKTQFYMSQARHHFFFFFFFYVTKNKYKNPEYIEHVEDVKAIILFPNDVSNETGVM